jgi:hypothetical protein
VSLGELIGGIGDRLRYTYDFGDDWEHEIVVEDLVDADPDTHYPVLVAAKGAYPPQDCGSPLGTRRPESDPRRPQPRTTPRDALDWLGLDNSSAFDPNAVTTDQIEEKVARNGVSR